MNESLQIDELKRYSINSKKSFFISSKKLNLLPIKFINNYNL